MDGCACSGREDFKISPEFADALPHSGDSDAGAVTSLGQVIQTFPRNSLAVVADLELDIVIVPLHLN